MTARDFVYWLQGYFEINEGGSTTSINPKQVQIIKNHLNLVFKHEIDPSMPDPTGELQKIHDNGIDTQLHLFPYLSEKTYRC